MSWIAIILTASGISSAATIAQLLAMLLIESLDGSNVSRNVRKARYSSKKPASHENNAGKGAASQYPSQKSISYESSTSEEKSDKHPVFQDSGKGLKTGRQGYTFKVHAWLPENHTTAIIFQNSGHVSATIAGCYFSFSGEKRIERWAVQQTNSLVGGFTKWLLGEVKSREVQHDFMDKFGNIPKNKWNTLSEDNEYHKGNEPREVEFCISEDLYPYVLDYYTSEGNYKGFPEHEYKLFENNCCATIASLIRVAIFPYLIELFRHPNSTDKAKYRLGNIDPEFDDDRYNILKDLYYKHNLEEHDVADSGSAIYNVLDYSDEEAIIQRWTIYSLWYSVLIYSHGINGAKLELEKKHYSLGERLPRTIFWYPLRLYHYAQFARSVVEEFSNVDIQVPDIYKVVWKGDYVDSEELTVLSVPIFKEWFDKDKKKKRR